MADLLDPRVQSLLDKQEIGEVLLRYCRGADCADEAMIASVFAPDSFVDYVSFYQGTGEGLAAIVGSSEPRPVTTHFLGNVLIELVGDIAYSESYYLGFVYYDDPAGDPTAPHKVDIRSYRFLDRWCRLNEGWKVAQRHVVKDFSWIAEKVDPADPVSATEGVRSDGDPFFRIKELTAPEQREAGVALMGFGPASMLLREPYDAFAARVARGEITAIEVAELGVTMVPSAEIFALRSGDLVEVSHV